MYLDNLGVQTRDEAETGAKSHWSAGSFAVEGVVHATRFRDNQGYLIGSSMSGLNLLLLLTTTNT